MPVDHQRVELIRERTVPYDRRTTIRTPEAAVKYIREHTSVASRPQEVMGAIFVDTRNRVLTAIPEIFVGTADRCVVDPKPILVAALLAGASGFFLFHTHPSGDPSPSSEDLSATRRIAEAATIVGTKLVDHIVVGDLSLGDSGWVSIAQSHGLTPGG